MSAFSFVKVWSFSEIYFFSQVRFSHITDVIDQAGIGLNVQESPPIPSGSFADYKAKNAKKPDQISLKGQLFDILVLKEEL